jgi:hypothetical protein
MIDEKASDEELKDKIKSQMEIIYRLETAAR